MADANNGKSTSGNKKLFNNLDKLINDIKNKKTARKNVIEKMKNHRKKPSKNQKLNG